jgi:hypothetical protein
VSVSLNTGNAFTSVATHSIKALGGSIGLGLSYNSPYLSRPGLQAEYYDGGTFEPTGQPRYRRVEPNIEVEWDLGSPVPGVLPADNFTSHWTGYFVAPADGDYYFGVRNDDRMTVSVGGTTVLDLPCCHDTGWSTTPVTMKAGEHKALSAGTPTVAARLVPCSRSGARSVSGWSRPSGSEPHRSRRSGPLV